MSRVQLALNVSNLDAAVDFYTQLFGSLPAKVRPGYANFAIVDPPLKLVLIEHRGRPGQRRRGRAEPPRRGGRGPRRRWPRASARLAGEGLDTLDQQETTCCYAVQDKVWVEDPDAMPRGRSTPSWPTRRSKPGIAGDGTCCARGRGRRRHRGGRRRELLLSTFHAAETARKRHERRRRCGVGCSRSSWAARSSPPSSSARASPPSNSRPATPASSSSRTRPRPQRASSPSS